MARLVQPDPWKQTNLWGSNRFDQRIDSWNSTLFLFLAINDHLAGANPIHKYWHPTYISKQSLSRMNLIAKPWSKNKPQAIHWPYLVADCSRKITNHPPTMHQPFTNHYDFGCPWVEFEDRPSNQLIYIYNKYIIYICGNRSKNGNMISSVMWYIIRR